MREFLRDKKSDIFFVVFFVLVFLAATNIMPHLALTMTSAGITVKADILLGSVISLGLLTKRKYASYFAVVSGFVFDVFVGNPYAFSPLVYFLCAYFARNAAVPFSRKTPLSVMLISCMLLWIRAVFSFFYLFAASSGVSTSTVIFIGVLPEFIANVLAATVMFMIMRIMMAVFRIPVAEDNGRRS